MSMTLQKSDFILVEYTGKVKETNKVFDTTVEETAKKERLYREGENYEPKLVVIGERWVLQALDENLTSTEVSKATSFEIPPEKAFGMRDPEKVKRVPLRQLTAKGITPKIGMRIEYTGKMATIRATGAGRVLLDFNPPLAGKTLVYELTIKKKLDTPEEKIAALIHRRVPEVEENKFKFMIEDKTLSIKMPEDAFYVEGIQIAKRGIALDVQRFIPEIIKVKFFEVFEQKTGV